MLNYAGTQRLKGIETSINIFLNYITIIFEICVHFPRLLGTTIEMPYCFPLLDRAKWKINRASK